MKKSCSYLLLALAASSLLANGPVSAAEKSALEIRMEAAQKVLADRSYGERWSSASALKTVEDAKAANTAGEAEQKRIDEALEVMKDWCHTRFFVNACIKDARDQHHEREKELRSVRLRADEVIRLNRVEERKARQESRKQNVRQPMQLGGTAEQAEPVESRGDVRAEEVKAKQTRAEERRALEEANVRAFEEKQLRAAEKAAERRDPIKMKKRDTSPSQPFEGHVGRTAADVEASRAQAAERAAQEEANQGAFDAKQAEARKRLEEAEATAAERKAKREARQANFNKTLEERRAAQKRYEESKDEKDSGLKKFF